MSPKVHDGNTIAAVAVAAHEVGHAIQHAEGYAPMKLRGALVPACVVTSKAAVPLLLIGILLEIFFSKIRILRTYDVKKFNYDEKIDDVFACMQKEHVHAHHPSR